MKKIQLLLSIMTCLLLTQTAQAANNYNSRQMQSQSDSVNEVMQSDIQDTQGQGKWHRPADESAAVVDPATAPQGWEKDMGNGYICCCTYKPCYYTTCECEYVPENCYKKCCRYVPQYYQQQRCRYVPQYYCETCCRQVPEYYTTCETKQCPKYTYHKHCKYIPEYNYRCCPQPCCPQPQPCCQ